MDVTNILKSALRAVDDAGIPGELKSLAFEKAVDLLSGGPVLVRRQEEPQRPPTLEGAPTAGDVPDSLVGRIATKLKLDLGTVEEVYHVEGDDLKVVAHRSKLNSSKMQGTKELALIVVAGRIAAGLDEQVLAEQIRTVADDYGRYDSANFARSIGEMDEDFRKSGTARRRSLSLRKAGWDHAAELVKRLGGGGEA